MIKTKIISAFPGSGKTFFHKKNTKNVLDSDSSNFSWVKDENGNNTKIRNPNFPENYVKYIKENVGKYDYILVSSHKEVRDELVRHNMFFYLVYPSENRKSEFLQLYKNRGNDENFIKIVENNWEKWIQDIEWDDNYGYVKKCMIFGFLEDNLDHLDILNTN